MDVKIGIIGGTGIVDPSVFRPVKEIGADTEFGKPSDRIRIIEFGGRQIAFLPRHGSGHTIPPHMVNYRANMKALKEVGYPHMVVPDHAPGHKEEGASRQAWAFEFGYIRAMIQAVNDGV